MDVVPYDPEWLPQLAALARAHGRLAPPGLTLADDEVARGLERHAFWPFYSPALAGGQTLLAVDGPDLLAAAQTGLVECGWGYGPTPGDGPDWVHDLHPSLFWLFAWPGSGAAAAAAAALAAKVVSAARAEGLPGLEAFRGGPGFLPFGTQLSSHWPHLWGPLRASGFRQPRDLLVYVGETSPEGIPLLDAPSHGLELRSRRSRLEAWLHGEPAGVCVATPLSGNSAGGDPRSGSWAAIRRLVVDPELRTRGIGSALFAEQLRHLHQRGITHYLLHLADGPDQQPARALYATFGAVVDRQQVLRVSF